MVCPLCFVKPPGKYFTYFDCGHVLCSTCASLNSPSHNCPSCNTLHFILFTGETMGAALYDAQLQKLNRSHNSWCTLTD